MSIWRSVAVGAGAIVMAAAAALSPAAASAAPADVANCYGWRTLTHGDSGLHAVVEPGAPYHVRLGTDTDGYQNFMFCELGYTNVGDRKIAFMANGHQDHYLIPNGVNGRVTATGTTASGNWWYVCALDSTWAEIRWQPDRANGQYLGRDSSGYLVATTSTAQGSVLWRADQFAGIWLPGCNY
jgi:hypothetical protein